METRKKNFKNLFIGICVVLLMASCFMIVQFIKINTDLIIWDYDIASEAFAKASEDLEEGKKTDRAILKELGNTAFKPIWQTRDLSEPLIISPKWYSSNLREFLFACIDAENLSGDEVKSYASRVNAITAELNKINWEEVRLDGSRFHGKRKDMFEVIGNIEELAWY